MEADCHIFLIYLAYWFFHIDIPRYITWYTRYIISNVFLPFWKTWQNDYKYVISGISNEKVGLIKKVLSQLPISTLHDSNFSIYSDTFMQSKVLLFWAVSIFQICYGTCQSVDKGIGISERTNKKKILKNNYGRMLNLVYQNLYTKFIIYLWLSTDMKSNFDILVYSIKSLFNV